MFTNAIWLYGQEWDRDPDRAFQWNSVHFISQIHLKPFEAIAAVQIEILNRKTFFTTLDLDISEHLEWHLWVCAGSPNNPKFRMNRKRIKL